MLIENKAGLEPNDIAVFRLVSGEEIIGKLVEVPSIANQQSFGIAKPIVVQMRMVSAQEAGIGFAPYCVSMDEKDTVFFYQSQMLNRPMKARTDIANQYRAATSSLALPRTGAGGHPIG